MKSRTTRMTTKGQVVIPKRLRDLAGMDVGDSIRLTSHGDTIHIARRSGWARATAGCLTSSRPPMEPDELDDLVERVSLQEAHDEWKALD